jgi:hypothetical protein
LLSKSNTSISQEPLQMNFPTPPPWQYLKGRRAGID